MDALVILFFCLENKVSFECSRERDEKKAVDFMEENDVHCSLYWWRFFSISFMHSPFSCSGGIFNSSLIAFRAHFDWDLFVKLFNVLYTQWVSIPSTERGHGDQGRTQVLGFGGSRPRWTWKKHERDYGPECTCPIKPSPPKTPK